MLPPGSVIEVPGVDELQREVQGLTAANGELAAALEDAKTTIEEQSEEQMQC